ncbi:MAG: hypothetical protein DWQ37_14145 [Planctomycetota bacterium]|nr:MAG: hypothetical protein DWQ37_14145 [Planctomycetota bacterium]
MVRDENDDSRFDEEDLPTSTDEDSREEKPSESGGTLNEEEQAGFDVTGSGPGSEQSTQADASGELAEYVVKEGVPPSALHASGNAPDETITMALDSDALRRPDSVASVPAAAASDDAESTQPEGTDLSEFAAGVRHPSLAEPPLFLRETEFARGGAASETLVRHADMSHAAIEDGSTVSVSVQVRMTEAALNQVAAAAIRKASEQSRAEIGAVAQRLEELSWEIYCREADRRAVWGW